MAEESKDWENVDQKAVLGRVDGWQALPSNRKRHWKLSAPIYVWDGGVRVYACW